MDLDRTRTVTHLLQSDYHLRHCETTLEQLAKPEKEKPWHNPKRSPNKMGRGCFVVGLKVRHPPYTTLPPTLSTTLRAFRLFLLLLLLLLLRPNQRKTPRPHGENTHTHTHTHTPHKKHLKFNILLAINFGINEQTCREKQELVTRRISF